MSTRTRRALVLAIAAGAGGSALAQCDVYRLGMPDFDQRRYGTLVANGGDGLPGGGDMYCVPTGMLNIMGYIANHGVSSAMGGAGNWQSQSQYHRVSVLDNLMGSLMGTSGANGTGGTGFYNGTVLWMLSHGMVGKFAVVHYYTGDNAGPSPMDMFIEMGIWGSMIAPVYGRYSFVGGDTGWNRTGGHCVTLYRVYNACGGTPNIGVKNPWTSDGSNFTQSDFESQSWDCIAENRLVEGRNRTMWRIGDTSDGVHRWIDEMMVVRPLCCLTTSQRFGKIKIIQLAPVFTAHNATLREFDSPNGQDITSVSPDLLFQNHWVTTAGAGRVRPALWKFDVSTRGFTHLLDFTSFVAAETDRRRNLIAICDGSVRKYDMVTAATPTLIGTDTPPGVPDALAIDDATDDIFTIDAATRTIRRYPGGSLFSHVDAPLDTPVPLTGTPFLAVNPDDGALWLGSTGVNGAVYRLEYRRGAAGGFLWGLNGAASHGSMTGPTSMQFGDEGTLRLLCGGVMKSFQIDPGTGRWLPAVQDEFDGQTGGGFIRIPRSRTNFDPLRHSGPGWDENILDPDVGLPPGTPDCLADFNDDGFIDFFDYSDYVLCFESGRCPRGRDADINEDGFEDFFDYADYVAAFEGGC